MDIFYIIAVGLILDHICPSKQGPALCQGSHGGGGTGDCQVEALGGRGAVPLERDLSPITPHHAQDQEQDNTTSRLAEPQRWNVVALMWPKASSTQPDISHLFLFLTLKC